jgi:hypothetical protein
MDDLNETEGAPGCEGVVLTKLLRLKQSNGLPEADSDTGLGSGRFAA